MATAKKISPIPTTTVKAFAYGQVVSVHDGITSHDCYCIDADTVTRISSLPKKKSPLSWTTKNCFPQMRYDFRGSLAVWENEHGYLAYRWFRSNGSRLHRNLAHQLSGLPILFPSAEIGQAAAELCFPKPHRALGYMWWTYPEILFF